MEALDDPDGLPADVAEKLKSIQDMLAAMQAEMARLADEADSASSNGTQAPDFNVLVDRVDQYLQQLIDDVQKPQARSQRLIERLFGEQVQENLLLSDEAPLASAPIDKASLSEGLPPLSAEDVKNLDNEPDMRRRAELIRAALLSRHETGDIPSDSS